MKVQALVLAALFAASMGNNILDISLEKKNTDKDDKTAEKKEKKYWDDEGVDNWEHGEHSAIWAFWAGSTYGLIPQETRERDPYCN